MGGIPWTSCLAEFFGTLYTHPELQVLRSQVLSELLYQEGEGSQAKSAFSGGNSSISILPSPTITFPSTSPAKENSIPVIKVVPRLADALREEEGERANASSAGGQAGDAAAGVPLQTTHIFITGSLFLVGEALSLLGHTPHSNKGCNQ